MRFSRIHAFIAVVATVPTIACGEDTSNWFAENGNQGAIAAGALHTCAVTQGGAVKCWGENDFGQLGTGTRDRSSVPRLVSGLGSGVKSVAAGERHTCVLTVAGGVMCFGENSDGQLGDDSVEPKLVPTQVVGLESGVTKVATGGYHTCALLNTGGVKCWGANTWGAVGDGTTFHKTVPTQVRGLESGVVSIDAGTSSSCAITSEKEAWCWGHTEGDDPAGVWTEGDAIYAARLAELDDPVREVAADAHVCVITTSGTGFCRGKFGTAPGIGWTDISWGLAWKPDAHPMALVAHRSQACAIRQSGTVECRGSNEHGELGDGTYESRNIATPADRMPARAVAVSAGRKHTCALTETGIVMCWGRNDEGQLGSGVGSDGSPVPVEVVGFP
ncbi:MAG: hypothetical protein FWD57_08130 [Polyangiaceae bacterium]|nr:hypothetical protein [Polyangiaceae bacterium]